MEHLTALVRDVPDFPTPGILFRDITPVLADVALLRRAVEALGAAFEGRGVTHVAAVESRGFIFGAPIALHLGVGLVPVRKVGKLPHRTERIDYALEYGTSALEMHADALQPGDRVLVVDDLLATGGTAAAAAALVRRLGAEVAGHAFLVTLSALGGAARLAPAPVESLVTY